MNDDLALGNVVIQMGWVTPEQLNALWNEHIAKPARPPFGTFLVEKRVISPDQLAQAQRRAAPTAATPATPAAPAPTPATNTPLPPRVPAQATPAPPPARASTQATSAPLPPRASTQATNTPAPPRASTQVTPPGPAPLPPRASTQVTSMAPPPVPPKPVLWTETLATLPRAEPPAGVNRWLFDVLRTAVAVGASDVHVHAGAVLRFRRAGRLEIVDTQPLDANATRPCLLSILDNEQRTHIGEKELDFAYTLPGIGRFRVNYFNQRQGLDGVFRIVPPKPPTLAELGLPDQLAKLTHFAQGIVLITGPAGCGKSSTLSALVNLINVDREDHVLTVEDPIETLHTSQKSIVNQRQAKRHTKSFARALKGALREDPDVIVIGEMRDLETISLALSAAETGHLVIATLHTNSVIRTINRLVGSFPPDQQGQIRTMISESLRAIVTQRLCARADGGGRVPALEILYVNSAVSAIIRDNRTIQLRSVLQTGTSQGMCLLDVSLENLVRAGTVTKEEAARHAEDPKRFLAMV